MPHPESRVVYHLRRALPALGLALLALTGCTATSGSSTDATGDGRSFPAGDGSMHFVPAGDRVAAPVISGRLVSGARYDLSALRGTVAVLNFWGSWCAPCRAEMPELEQVYTATKAAGVQFVGVDVREDAASGARFLRDHAITYPSLSDPDVVVAARFRTLPPQAVPTTVVLDRSGRVAATFFGPLTAVQLQPVIQRVAAESTA